MLVHGRTEPTGGHIRVGTIDRAFYTHAMDSGRRSLLAAAALLPLAPSAFGERARAAQPRRPNSRAPLRISLAQWSLHRTIRAGKLDHLDFARAAKRDYGLDGVEYVNQFFAEKACDFAYLAEMKKRAEGEGVASLLIMIDGEGPLASEDVAQRRAAIGNHFKWIAAAAYLGCHSVRLNAQGSGSREQQLDAMADSLQELGDVANGYGLNVLVENHGGLSSDGAWLSGVMKKADHPRVGTLPDFGNFTIGPASKEGGELQTYDRYRGVEELIPYAKALSAKSHDFDAQGNETATDFARMAQIAQAAGYAGWVGVEYEGDRLSEPDGIRKTIELVRRTFGVAAAK